MSSDAKKASAPASNPTMSQQQFFNQTYYLFLILLILNFFFSVYMFYKVKGMENSVAAAPTAAAPVDGTAPAADPTAVSITKPDVATEPWRGAQDARYVIVEYSDYECPFCQTVHPDLKRIIDENPDLGWVFRDFPLSFHPKAQKLAEAALCAYDLGGNDAYWSLSDAIFTAMPTLEVSGVADLASGLGYDGASIQSCMDAGTNADKVTADLNDATSAGIAATPTMVIYDMETDKQYKIEGALPYDSLIQSINDFKASN